LSVGWPRSLRFVWMPVLLLAATVILASQNTKNSVGQIYETESAYNYIQVLQRDNTTLLRLNDGQGVHSMYDPNILAFNGPWMQFLAGPFFNSPPYAVMDSRDQVRRLPHHRGRECRGGHSVDPQPEGLDAQV
jgi:hypothetical protein